ncbi:MAG: rhodanese-like domain-containing protein, partial [Methylophilales bacterium]|nr:rhodanese-like domain-containing protein [Methylophilales bacterium]
PSFIIDVRSEEDFNLGHIPNATNIPLEVIDEKIKLITKNSKKLFLIYCQKGIRSDRAVNILSKLGFENTVSIDGGINAWINAQLPIVSK